MISGSSRPSSTPLANSLGDGEHRGAGDQGQRLGALEPVRVLGLEVLALRQELLRARAATLRQDRQVRQPQGTLSRSLVVPRTPTNVWFSGRAGRNPEFSHGSQGGPGGSSRCPQAVHKCPRGGGGRGAGLTGWRSRAYRIEVELSMAAAACLPMGEDPPGRPE